MLRLSLGHLETKFRETKCEKRYKLQRQFHPQLFFSALIIVYRIGKMLKSPGDRFTQHHNAGALPDNLPSSEGPGRQRYTRHGILKNRIVLSKSMCYHRSYSYSHNVFSAKKYYDTDRKLARDFKRAFNPEEGQASLSVQFRRYQKW